MDTKKTNPVLVDLVRQLRRWSWEHEAPIWRDIAKRLERPASSWAEVNVSRVERHLGEDATVVVPGKLLGSGRLTKPVTVAAFDFSRSARQKVESAGGECLPIAQLVERNPDGTDVRILQ